MRNYPHTRLFVGPARTVDITGPHIQILDTSTGSVLHSTTTFPEEKKAGVLKSGPIRCAAVDRDVRYLITAGEDKMLKVWDLADGLQLLSERELPKKPTSLAFTADAQTILASDKFGDVFSYPFTYVPLTQDQKKEQQRKRDALSSHENPSGGNLILGHASPLNAFLLTHDEKYIITADRDEHIRVSWFPKGYNIEMYCLGHLKFVSAIHIPASEPTTLISGGGDPMLKVWDWLGGKLKYEVPILDSVEPFIGVKATKRKRGLPEDGGEGTLPEGTKFRRKKGKNATKGKGKEREGTAEEGEGEQAEGAEEEPAEQKPETVLVIHAIESVQAESGAYVVFSAVGTTALFTFPLKTGVSTSDIQHFDFKRPVLDFTILEGKSILVSLDGEWKRSEEDGEVSVDNSMVRVVKFAEGGKLTEDEETLKSVVTTLNTSALVTATAEELKKLDVYGDLVAMPKYAADADGEALPVENLLPGSLPIGAPELSSSETAKLAAAAKGKVELSKKELGRMKTKQAVLAKAQEQGLGINSPRETEDGEERETKKMKQDGDVEMEGA
ncbi:WD40 repeat-like protein [Agrocybe pediades]|nr:WD40 repeat-like protein [Agrocybe pediades]